MTWTETIDIDAPAEDVFDAMLDQDRVMSWSAWPEATGFTCSVEGDSRSPGSEIVFRDKKGSRKLHIKDLDMLKSHVESHTATPSQ